MRHPRRLPCWGGHGLAVSAAVAGLLAIGLTACPATPTTTATTAPIATTATTAPIATTSTPSATATSAPATPKPTAGPTSALIIEPDQGMDPIYAAMGSPARNLDLSMYELVDTRAESILATDAGRGVTVRVILDHGREASQNQPAYTYLATHGVQVRWAPSSFRAFHIKMLCIDNSGCLVMTLNLTSRYYANTRDFAVTDSNPVDVSSMEATFTADFDGSPTAPSAGTDLIWSPGSSAGLTSLIGSATSELLVYNEEMSDPATVASLAAAARRGVVVKVVMTDQTSWSAEFSALTAAGVQLRVFHGESPIYIHAKMIVADRRQAFVGSENFSRASLDDNRELGLAVTDPAIVGPAVTTFIADFAAAQPWAG
ncbi:MAG TPA: phospholipase D-like domain-containing protein [Acidimicrobiales bacterium]|nr:phospholipase D-like domain-containing protein [Acidimicrobiales bacterium]